MIRSTAFGVAMVMVTVGLAQQQPPTPQQPPAGQKPVEHPATKPVDQAALEKEFTERMTNAVLNGQFTMGDRPPKADKYTIVSVRKLFGDNWLFNARVQYGDK